MDSNLKVRSVEEIFIIDKVIDAYFEDTKGYCEQESGLTVEQRKQFLMNFIRVMNVSLTNELLYELDKINCDELYSCSVNIEDFKNFEQILPNDYNIFDFLNIINFFKSKLYVAVDEIIESSIRYLKFNDRLNYFSSCEYSILDLCVVSVTDELEFSLKFPKSYEFVSKNDYIKSKFQYYELLILKKNDDDLLDYLSKISFRSNSKRGS